MKHTTPPKHRYVEWISPEEMHQAALEWLSELNFARDEQRFLDDLVKSFTLQLTDSKVFSRSQKIIAEIVNSEHQLLSLMKQVQAHENLLEIMIDDVDQPDLEKAYKDEHRHLIEQVGTYLSDYRKQKKRLFNLMTEVMKRDKQKRLLT